MTSANRVAQRVVTLRRWVGTILLLCSAAVCPSGVTAQDLEPRAYAASPTGLTFLVVGVGRSSGGVFVDPSLPVEDVQATVGALTVGAGTTFSLFGRTALVVGAVPYVRAT